MMLLDRNFGGFSRFSILNEFLDKQPARRPDAIILNPRRSWIEKGSDFRGSPHMQQNQRPIEGLSEGKGGGGGGFGSLIALNCQQNRPSGGRPAVPRIPVGGNRQHGARGKTYKLLGNGADHHRTDPLPPLSANHNQPSLVLPCDINQHFGYGPLPDLGMTGDALHEQVGAEFVEHAAGLLT
jgi:hypothetical protein